MIDTVKLRSPVVDEGTAAHLERQSVLKQGIQLSTGEVLYELTSGNLDGSFDSRISFRVMREDWVSVEGRVRLIPSRPYIVVECSWHKFFYGQNVFGNPVNFQALAELVVNLLGEIMSNDHEVFHDASKWQVRRVDWAEVFRLSPAAQREFFRQFRDVHYPRRSRKEARYDSSHHYPGSTTTFRIYSKGPEFAENGASVLRRALVKYQQALVGQKPGSNSGVVLPRVLQNNDSYRWIERKVKAVQRLANRRLRVEVQINGDKLRYDFEDYPFVSQITDEYLIDVYQQQVLKLFKEGKSEMETVRTYDRVHARLIQCYGYRVGNLLMSFWMLLSGRGENAVREVTSKAQFYAKRKKLIDAGISWHSVDTHTVSHETALPRDFIPLPSDPRRCVDRVSANSIFRFCPVERFRLLNAAKVA